MGRGGLALLCALAWLATPTTASALTAQEAILRARPAVALVTARVEAEVTLDCGSGPTTVRPAPFLELGSGWFVDGRGWLLTNAHVVDPAHRVPPWVVHDLKKSAADLACVEPILRARGLDRRQHPDVVDRLHREIGARALAGATFASERQIAVVLSSGTTLPAVVERFSPPLYLDAANRPAPDSGRDLALLRVPAGVYPALSLAVQPPKFGDPVHVLGFPDVVRRHELLQRARVEASVTNGAVSGLGNRDATGQEVIEIDAPATYGNSGGPVIGDDAAVVGVMTFLSVSPAGGTVQGFNFLIPARDVRAFLQGTPVTRPGESPFNDAWHAGLEALFARRYARAAARIAAADRLVPGLVDVGRALAEAEDRVRNPPGRRAPWAWVTLGVTAVSAGAFGGMYGRRWWRNRFRIQPAQVVAAIEAGQNPRLLDARSRTDYETSPLKLPGAVRLDPEDAAAGRIHPDADPRQLIVAYCTTPDERTSAVVAQTLRRRGYTNVRVLKGGLGGWTNARLPVEAKASLPSIGVEIYTALTLGEVERRAFRAGELICREGDDPRGEAYVVHAGSVEIRKRVHGAEQTLAVRGEGELVGEIALFRRGARSASMVAVSDVELLVITSERLDWLIRNRPQLTMEILRRMAEIIGAGDAERPDPGPGA